MGVEWYTPPEIIHAARVTLGDIDLDPATSEKAQAVVQAVRYYTKEQDGLTLPWSGRVWCNPPYSRGLLSGFVMKALSEYEQGNVSAICLLVPFIGQSEWFLKTLEAGATGLLVRRKIRFWNEDNTHRWPIVIFYLGPSPGRFRRAFFEWGVFIKMEPRDERGDR